MKPSLRQYFLLLSLLVVIASSACKKDPVPDPDPTPIKPETSITFAAVDTAYAVPGVLIGITPNSDDRDNGVFLRTGTTSSSGQYKFSNLSALTYYYRASLVRNGGTVQRSGSVELAANERRTVNLQF